MYIDLLDGKKPHLLKQAASTGVGPGCCIPPCALLDPAYDFRGMPRVRECVIDPRYGVTQRISEAVFDVEIRRWMATLAAWWTRDYLLAEAPRATVASPRTLRR